MGGNAHHPNDERRAVGKADCAVFENLEGAVRRGQGRKEKKRNDCPPAVQTCGVVTPVMETQIQNFRMILFPCRLPTMKNY